MNSYELVKGFAPMIRETVRTKRMPPYFADPHIGTFKNDQGLTADQTKTLVHWIEAGAPRGDGPDPLLANAGKVAPEWPPELGKPDVVVDLPTFKVPATGLVEYQNQVVDNPFKENTWLKAIAMKPGDRRVLHHVVSNHIPDPNQPAAAIPGGSVGSYTPGAQPQIMADNSGAPVPAGGKLHFQMHYTTMGKETVDKTEVGFYTLKSPPEYIKRSTVISTFALYIPAGEARHTRRSPTCILPGRRLPLHALSALPLPRLPRGAEGGDAGRQGSHAPVAAEVRLQLAARLRSGDADPGEGRDQAGRHLGLRQLRAQPGQPGSEAQRHLGRTDP